MRRFPIERRRFALLIILGFSPAAPAAAQLAPIEANEGLLSVQRSLRLEVYINGRSTQLVEPFDFMPPDRLAARRGDLEETGIKVAGEAGPRDIVPLEGLQGVVYRFDEPHQRIDFTLNDAMRLAKHYDAAVSQERAPKPQADWGALVNYSLFGTSANVVGAVPHFSGFNATIEARAFGPIGEISQSAIAGDTVTSNRKYMRLDTTYTYSDPDRMMTARAGDMISGALIWARPIRYGGFQLQRDFALRSDLVTRPLPSVTGSAALPSTVDVFVNNVKAMSQDVSPGPYSITNIPLVSGTGTARVVVSDAAGRQTETALPFVTAPTLLRPGLDDFSVDAGFARRFYGTISNDYDQQPVVSITDRHGVSDWLTLDGHAEGSAGLLNGGAGVETRLWNWGVISTAVSASRSGGASGTQVFAGYSVAIGPLTLDASAQRTFDTFDDLASVTATRRATVSVASSLASGLFPQTVRSPLSLDRLSVGMPLPFELGAASATFIDLVEADRTHSRILTASLSRALPYDISFFASAFVDLTRRDSAGVFAGLSMPLGPKVRATAGGALAHDGTYADIDIARTLPREDGGVGWRLRDLEGQAAYRSGEGAYRSAYGTADVIVTQQKRVISSEGQFDGSVGIMKGGGLFLGNRVDDGFALIDTGVPNIPVFQDNRPIGETNALGKLVVADLRSYQRNQIAIDPITLPRNAEALSTKQIVAPAGRSGVRLDFGVETNIKSALVTFQDGQGKPLPVGSRGQLVGHPDPFVVGYDGQAYLKHLDPDNSVTIEISDSTCRATFAFQAASAVAARIGPVPCL